jgi:hypothetical protein
LLLLLGLAQGFSPAKNPHQCKGLQFRAFSSIARLLPHKPYNFRRTPPTHRGIPAPIRSTDHWFRRRKIAARQGASTMIHDLILALAFLGLIISPALIAMRSGKEEKDSL